jgi:hypothetical protein
MLDRPAMGEPQAFGFFGQCQTVTEITGGIAVTRAEGGKKLNSELHHGLRVMPI